MVSSRTNKVTLAKNKLYGQLRITNDCCSRAEEAWYGHLQESLGLIEDFENIEVKDSSDDPPEMNLKRDSKYVEFQYNGSKFEVEITRTEGPTSTIPKFKLNEIGKDLEALPISSKGGGVRNLTASIYHRIVYGQKGLQRISEHPELDSEEVCEIASEHDLDIYNPNAPQNVDFSETRRDFPVTLSNSGDYIWKTAKRVAEELNYKIVDDLGREGNLALGEDIERFIHQGTTEVTLTDQSSDLILEYSRDSDSIKIEARKRDGEEVSQIAELEQTDPEEAVDELLQLLE